MPTLDIITEMEWAGLDASSIDSGGQLRPHQELNNTVTLFSNEGSLQHPPYFKQFGKKEQPLRNRRREQNISEKAWKGLIDPEETYRHHRTLDSAKMMEYWLDVYESLRDEGAADKLDNLLAKIKLPTPLKQGIDGSRYVLEKVFKAYRKPENLAASFPSNIEEMLVLAYYYKTEGGTDGLGITTESARAFNTLVKELGLYNDQDLLAFAIIDHEIEHRKRQPPKKATAEELEKYEFETRERKFNEYVRKSEDPREEVAAKYTKLAKIAHALAYGHPGVGSLSNVAATRLARKKGLECATGRISPDSIGDELYSGPPGYLDDIARTTIPGTGTKDPEGIQAYFEGTSEPLSRLESQRAAEQHQPAQHTPAEYSPKEYCPARACSAQTRPAQNTPQRHQATHHQPGD
ncbi:hypothetical protein HYU11_04410 [Candidatus Woesearchaeota archaeon]|nr:hypothetical protein [Candidatus Woesearchaeota archaeon]